MTICRTEMGKAWHQVISRKWHHFLLDTSARDVMKSRLILCLSVLLMGILLASCHTCTQCYMGYEPVGTRFAALTNGVYAGIVYGHLWQYTNGPYIGDMDIAPTARFHYAGYDVHMASPYRLRISVGAHMTNVSAWSGTIKVGRVTVNDSRGIPLFETNSAGSVSLEPHWMARYTNTMANNAGFVSYDSQCGCWPRAVAELSIPLENLSFGEGAVVCVSATVTYPNGNVVVMKQTFQGLGWITNLRVRGYDDVLERKMTPLRE